MLTQIIEIAKGAGNIILAKFKQDLSVNYKLDKSVYTEADLLSNEYIYQRLSKCFPTIPIISEEKVLTISFAERVSWEYCFLVDPLDGSKEFIAGSPEFTINIALIKHQKPVLGLVYAPALDLCYYAEKGQGAFKAQSHTVKPLNCLMQSSRSNSPLRIIMSRSHLNEATQQYVDDLKRTHEVTSISVGSALKFGWIAEGLADLYPRFAPTMEWDTAAGQMIVNEVGKKVRQYDLKEELVYNKRSLVNPSFIVE